MFKLNRKIWIWIQFWRQFENTNFIFICHFKISFSLWWRAEIHAPNLESNIIRCHSREELVQRIFINILFALMYSIEPLSDFILKSLICASQRLSKSHQRNRVLHHIAKACASLDIYLQRLCKNWHIWLSSWMVSS